jgi:hypothetical protein
VKVSKSVDWLEDAVFENGKYQCKCIMCEGVFVGMKRRAYCRKCHDELEKAGCWYITEDFSNSDPASLSKALRSGHADVRRTSCVKQRKPCPLLVTIHISRLREKD